MRENLNNNQRNNHIWHTAVCCRGWNDSKDNSWAVWHKVHFYWNQWRHCCWLYQDKDYTAQSLKAKCQISLNW